MRRIFFASIAVLIACGTDAIPTSPGGSGDTTGGEVGDAASMDATPDATVDDATVDDAADATADSVATDALSDAAATDAAADGGADGAIEVKSDATVDAAVDATVTPSAACKLDCDKQKSDCASIDLSQCYGLCDYVVPGLKAGACTEKQTAQWLCETAVKWQCAPDQNVVGQLADPASCKAENAAKVAACGTCAPTYSGSIPGAALDLSQTPCTFSISAAKGVFKLPYRFKVLSSQAVSVAGNMGSCPPPPGDIFGGFAMFHTVSGGSQNWCLCDTGLCAPSDPPPAPSVVGTYDVTFAWDGNNFSGPSDTGFKPGPAFPPGSYVFSVTVAGKVKGADGGVASFKGEAKLPITLTP